MSGAQIGVDSEELEARNATVEELTQRIETLSSMDEDELGRWTSLDWVLITVLGLVGPLVVLYGFSP